MLKSIFHILLATISLSLQAQEKENCSCTYPDTEIKFGSFGKLSRVIDDKLSKYFHDPDSFNKNVFYYTLLMDYGRMISDLVYHKPFVMQEKNNLFKLNLTPCHSPKNSYRLPFFLYDSKNDRHKNQEEQSKLVYSLTSNQLKFIVDTQFILSKGKVAPIYFDILKNDFSFTVQENDMYFSSEFKLKPCQEDIQVRDININFKIENAELIIDEEQIFSKFDIHRSINSNKIYNHRLRHNFYKFKGVFANKLKGKLSMNGKETDIDLLNLCINNQFIFMILDIKKLTIPENKIQLNDFYQVLNDKGYQKDELTEQMSQELSERMPKLISIYKIQAK